MFIVQKANIMPHKCALQFLRFITLEEQARFSSRVRCWKQPKIEVLSTKDQIFSSKQDKQLR